MRLLQLTPAAATNINRQAQHQPPTSFASFCRVLSRESFPRCFGMTFIATCMQHKRLVTI